MKPIIIDAATIFDPARLLAVLASIDIRYSEVWISQKYDHFKEKDFITGFGTESRFGLLPDENGNFKADPLSIPSIDEKLDPKSWASGPKILRWALEKGMAVPKNFFKYEELAKELENRYEIGGLSEAIMLGSPHEFDLRAGKEATEKYLKRSGKSCLGPEYAWRLEPYGIGHGLGLILATAQAEGVDTFFSHPFFMDQISTHNYTFYKKEEARKFPFIEQNDDRKKEITIKEALDNAGTLLKSPEPISLSEIAFFLTQRERIECITGIITASKELEIRNKDCGIIASKFIGTTAIDTAFFGGLPVTSSLASIYDVAARFFFGKK